MYDFSRKGIPDGTKIILYGAGKVGQGFYQNIRKDDNLQLVAWIDRDFEQYQKQGLKVESPDNINKMEYDYIIMAFLREDMALKIENKLKDTYRIPERKFLWIEPVYLLGQLWEI